jgi:hypothetical protein
MAGRGSLVEARMRAVGNADDDAPVHAPPDGLFLLSEYRGPSGPLTVAQPESLQATWVGGGTDGPLVIPWGTLDSIDDAGAYRRLADGVRTTDDSAFPLVVRLVGTSVRTSKRWLEIDVDDGTHYEMRRAFFRGAWLERDGDLVAKGFRGDALEVIDSATALDARLVAALKATLWRMLALPALPPFEIPGD